MEKYKFGNSMDAYYVALPTPLKDDAFTIDYDAFRTYVRNFVNFPGFKEIGGGIIVLPEAGEIFTMTTEEKQKMITIALEEAKGKVPVVAGAANVTTRQQVEDAVWAAEQGVDGIFAMPAYGCLDLTLTWDKKTVPEAYSNICEAIQEKVDLPIIAHGAGVPDAYHGISYPIETVLYCAERVPNLVAWKMMYAHRAYVNVGLALRQYEKETGHHIGVFVAAGDQYFDAMTNNLCDGSVSCFWNYAEDFNIELIKAFKAGDLAKMREIWFDKGLYNLHRAVTGDSTRLHTTFKAAAWLRGMIPNPYVRAPMVQVFKSEVETLRNALKACGAQLIPDEEIEAVVNKLPR